MDATGAAREDGFERVVHRKAKRDRLVVCEAMLEGVQRLRHAAVDRRPRPGRGFVTRPVRRVGAVGGIKRPVHFVAHALVVQDLQRLAKRSTRVRVRHALVVAYQVVPIQARRLVARVRARLQFVKLQERGKGTDGAAAEAVVVVHRGHLLPEVDGQHVGWAVGRAVARARGRDHVLVVRVRWVVRQTQVPAVRYVGVPPVPLDHECVRRSLFELVSQVVKESRRIVAHCVCAGVWSEREEHSGAGAFGANAEVVGGPQAANILYQNKHNLVRLALFTGTRCYSLGRLLASPLRCVASPLLFFTCAWRRWWRDDASHERWRHPQSRASKH